MSRFAAVSTAKVKPERSLSPSSKRASSPPSSKKKAFVSTVRRGDEFGSPPPVPPRLPAQESKEIDTSMDNMFSYPAEISEPDYLAPSYVHLLQRKSVRWLNLSLTLWSLTVLDVHRTVDLRSLTQFLEVVSWRAHGKIDADEFSALYSEWSSSNASSSLLPIPVINKASQRRVAVGVFALRQILLQKNYEEADLDLCVGIIINELNIRMMNASISFTANKSPQHNPFSLEVCTDRWLSLSEALFFVLDTPGYGVLRFDELFFYNACVTIGLQGWSNGEELEEDLSLGSLTASTLQLMQDTGANTIVSIRKHDAEYRSMIAAEQRGMSPSRRNQGRVTSHGHSQGNHSISSPSSSSSAAALYMNSHKSYGGKHEVTLSMFKKYLLKRKVGEMALATLLDHVRACVERVARLAQVNRADLLFHACKPFEDLDTIGSPRLWQQAVLSASGYYSQRDESTGAMRAPPPILQFLLTDAERLLPGSLRANELPIEGTDFVAPGSVPHGISTGVEVRSHYWAEGDSREPVHSPMAANEELHEAVYRTWLQFRRWGTDASILSTEHVGVDMMRSKSGGSSAGGSSGADGGNVGPSGGGVNGSGFYSRLLNQGDLADVQRDPTYQLILTCVLQYKALQHLLVAALFDMTTSQYGTSRMQHGHDPRSGSLIVVCAGLTPNARKMMIELGYGDENDNEDAGADGDPAVGTGNVAGAAEELKSSSQESPSKGLDGMFSTLGVSGAVGTGSSSRGNSLSTPHSRSASGGTGTGTGTSHVATSALSPESAAASSSGYHSEHELSSPATRNSKSTANATANANANAYVAVNATVSQRGLPRPPPRSRGGSSKAPAAAGNAAGNAAGAFDEGYDGGYTSGNSVPSVPRTARRRAQRLQMDTPAEVRNAALAAAEQASSSGSTSAGKPQPRLNRLGSPNRGRVARVGGSAAAGAGAGAGAAGTEGGSSSQEDSSVPLTGSAGGDGKGDNSNNSHVHSQRGRANSRGRIEQEIAQAQWTPLFNSTALDSDTDAVADNTSAPAPARAPTPTSTGAQSQAQWQQRAPVSASAAGTTGAAAGVAHVGAEAGAGVALTTPTKLNLSEEEAQLLSELLQAQDLHTQTELLSRMKQLRLAVDLPRPPGQAHSQPKAEERTDSQLSSTGPASMAVQSIGDAASAASSGPETIEQLLREGKGAGKYAQMLREILRKMSLKDAKMQLASLEQVLQLGQDIVLMDSNEKKGAGSGRHNRGAGSGAGASEGVGAVRRGPLSPTSSPERGGISPSDSGRGSGGAAGVRSRSRSRATSRGAPRPIGSPTSSSSPSDMPVIRGAAGLPFAPSAGAASDNRAQHDIGRGDGGSGGAGQSRGGGNAGNSRPRAAAGRSGAISRLSKVPGHTPDPSIKKKKSAFGHPV